MRRSARSSRHIGHRWSLLIQSEIHSLQKACAHYKTTSSFSTRQMQHSSVRYDGCFCSFGNLSASSYCSKSMSSSSPCFFSSSCSSTYSSCIFSSASRAARATYCDSCLSVMGPCSDNLRPISGLKVDNRSRTSGICTPLSLSYLSCSNVASGIISLTNWKNA